MTEPEFTPGPWVVELLHSGGYTITSAEDKDFVIVAETVGGLRAEVEKANSHLLAAAPKFYSEAKIDLVDLACLACAVHRGDPVADILFRIKLIRERKERFLAKARGES